ncbi:hypothetical protein [Bradyrhizobium sp. DASA03120]|uniref:hypothetical protein n=1 Tax=Bradyrhizobium sp. SMVTL-02 TaxID=3395917 RepID=UPI003F6FEB84
MSPTKATIAALIKASHTAGETEVWSTNSLGEAVIVQYIHLMDSVITGQRVTTFRVAVLKKRENGEWHVANNIIA